MLESILGRVSAGEDLTMEEMAATIGTIMEGHCQESEIAMLLTSLRAKGESVAEVAGAAAAMRKHMTPIHTSRSGLLDTCGTGGDGSGTFNISTAAALVASAAGVPVAKHGNRAITSRTGSADVLVELGVNVEASVACVQSCLDELGICFCFAPLLHPSMKHVAPVRKKLGVPTIFNLLGPLCNPAGAPYQLLGVARPELRELLGQALGMLGTQRALVVCGDDGLDEVSLGGATQVTQVTDGELSEFTWTPSDFGMDCADNQSMLVDGSVESAKLIREILDGKPGPPRDVVVTNAAAALWTAGHASTPEDCARAAAAVIDNGGAADLLTKLAELSHS